jgi:hypothetical protein
MTTTVPFCGPVSATEMANPSTVVIIEGTPAKLQHFACLRAAEMVLSPRFRQR